MENQFIPYEQALDLKKLGFNEQCFGYFENPNSFHEKEILVINYNNTTLTSEQQKRPKLYKIDNRNSNLPQWATSAPTYQQALQWFKDKYNMKFYIRPDIWNKWNTVYILDSIIEYEYVGDYDTEEKANLMCLKKLIEIVKKIKI